MLRKALARVEVAVVRGWKLRLLGCQERVYLVLRARAVRREARLAKRKGLSPTPQHLVTGELGEDLAFFFLRRLGFTVVARRWRSERGRGDLDLVAWDGGTLVVVEVKTRTGVSPLFGPPERAVDYEKRRMLTQTAAHYLQQIPAREREGVPVRFDVVAVTLRPHTTEAAEIRHFPAAFSPERRVARR